MKLFVSGIGTDVGKTVVAAILTEALQADYWKPVQAGSLSFTDTDQVKEWVINDKSRFHPESHRLTTPASPHYAAEVDGIDIQMNKLQLPSTDNHLLVEGAGGLLVPLNDQKLVIDLIKSLSFPVVLVSRNFLGSINQTLLSIEALQRRNIPIAGLVFSGEHKPSTEDYIRQYTGVPYLGRMDEEDTINSEVIARYADKWQPSLNKILSATN